MKAAVYAISLNEEAHIRRWYESVKDADHILLADTGSTDKTVEIARELGIEVVEIRISPWRFDLARNAALTYLPLDLDWCVSLDLDEVMLPGWRQALEALPEGTTRPRYDYVWSWNPDGTPDIQFQRAHIHTRTGYLWRSPVHESLARYGEVAEVERYAPGLVVHHLADETKPRSQYLPLLKLAVEEDPNNDRNAFYYARELYFHGRVEEAAAAFKHHLMMPSATWLPERAASMRYLAKCEPERRVQWLTSAAAESPGRREPLVELAEYHYDKQDWEAVAAFASAALAIRSRPNDFLSESFAWGALPYEYMYMALGNFGQYAEAAQYCAWALEFLPGDERLIKNLEWLQQAAQRQAEAENENAPA